MLKCIGASVRRLFSSQRGGISVHIGLGIMALAGMSGLGAETTFLYYKQRQMQAATDAASLSGVVALMHGGNASNEVAAIAGRMGFTTGMDGVTVTVHSPPVNGAYSGTSGAVEVQISQPHNMVLMRLFTNSSVTVATHSVASQSGGGGKYCVLALDPSAAQAMSLKNNAAMPNTECGAAVNSTSDTALALSNNAAIFGPVAVSGSWSLANNAKLWGAHTDHATATPDPYADVQVETAPACTAQSGSGSNNLTRNLTPGHFCSGWDFKNNVTLNLAAGTYYIDSKLSLKNNVVLNGLGGVTIVVNGNYAIDIANNATLNMTAPTSGNYSGITFMGLRTATSTVTQKFSNNTVLNVTGAVYFPNQIVEFDNNGTTSPTGCTQVIGRKIVMMNNANLDNNCDGTGVTQIGASVRLVE